jgi:hypothetical protein
VSVAESTRYIQVPVTVSEDATRYVTVTRPAAEQALPRYVTVAGGEPVPRYVTLSESDASAVRYIPVAAEPAARYLPVSSSGGDGGSGAATTRYIPVTLADAAADIHPEPLASRYVAVTAATNTGNEGSSPRYLPVTVTSNSSTTRYVITSGKSTYLKINK